MKRYLMCILAVSCLAFPAHEQRVQASDFQHVFKERIDVMNSIDKQMESIAKMFKGEAEFDNMLMRKAAQTVAGHSRTMPILFPPNSNDRPSESRDEIWSRWDEFVEITEKLAEDANSLAAQSANAKSPADVVEALIAVGSRCKSCHAAFRLVLSH